MKKLSLDEKYDKYKQWYIKQQQIAMRQGEGMLSPLYNKKQFRNVYEETKADLKQLVDEGKRKAVGNIYQYMTREQTYAMDQGMYRGLKDLYKEAGQKITFNRFTSYEEIRTEAPDEVWDTVQRYYEQMRIDGMSSGAAHDLIAQMFFGSV